MLQSLLIVRIDLVRDRYEPWIRRGLHMSSPSERGGIGWGISKHSSVAQLNILAVLAREPQGIEKPKFLFIYGVKSLTTWR